MHYFIGYRINGPKKRQIIGLCTYYELGFIKRACILHTIDFNRALFFCTPIMNTDTDTVCLDVDVSFLFV